MHAEKLNARSGIRWCGVVWCDGLGCDGVSTSGSRVVQRWQREASDAMSTHATRGGVHQTRGQVR